MGLFSYGGDYMPNKDCENAKSKRFAEIYVFEQTGNQVQSYIQMCKEFNIEQTQNYVYQRQAASKYFRKPEVQEYIRQFRAEAQEKYDVRKEEIVIALQDIAFDTDNYKKDRLAALKQLTDIGGFAESNINLKADTKLEVVIE